MNQNTIHIQPRSDRKNVSPFRDVMSTFFDDRFFDPFRELRQFEDTARRMFPKVDVEENDTDIVVKANIPGVDSKDIDVNVEADTLSLSGVTRRENTDEDKEKQYYHYEREYGEFRRDIPLPASVDPSQTKAISKNGVLTITMPKVTQESRTKVEIEEQE